MFLRRPTALATSCTVLLACVALVGCASKQAAPAESPAAESPAAAPAEPTERATLSADECTAQGGTVVGDIGDGAIHRPDYRCPSGAEPSGSIQAAGDGPVAVEGSVCCPG